MNKERLTKCTTRYAFTLAFYEREITMTTYPFAFYQGQSSPTY
jgi:hypothetical protein